jgi:hypothetical protein
MVFRRAQRLPLVNELLAVLQDELMPKKTLGLRKSDTSVVGDEMLARRRAFVTA